VPNPSFLLDTSPLSILCGFPLQGTLYIHTILDYAELVLADEVTDEIRLATKGKVARTVLPLIAAGNVRTINTPTGPSILDTAYGKELGLGERGTIKAALATELPLVLDDMRAYVAACRFGLRPIVFQDFIIRLVKEHGLPKDAAIEIVTTTARQFPAMFLAHTLEMLRQE
jgi:hypothetical protein